jgi:hypothetical protein
MSEDGKYRYHLYRKLADGDRRIATFIMLNPSTADHEIDDPTVRKCIGFCRRWRCGELHVVNLFAIRATRPAEMKLAADPVGPENIGWVKRAVSTVNATNDSDQRNAVICAWGTHGSYLDQDMAVLSSIQSACKPMALGFTRDGHPRHPLYVPYGAVLAEFSARRLSVARVRSIWSDSPSSRMLVAR